MTWRPANTATPSQAMRAKELLQSSLADGSWADGKVLVEEGGVQFRAAYHPNSPGPGVHPGVEVWVQGSSTAKVETGLVAPWRPNPANRASPEEREMVLAEFEKRGWPRDEADAMVSIESGWDPTARNKQGFSGLIGFGPWFVKRWGLPGPIWQMTAAQQAPLVGRYLDEATGGKRWRYPGDTYMTGAAPAFIGAPDSTVVYPKGGKAWEQNPGWRPPGGGDITAGSIRATLLRRLSKGGSGYQPPGPKVETADTEPPSAPDSLQSQSLLEFLRTLQREAKSRDAYITSTSPAIVNAIRAFQRSRGLRDDGRIGPLTLGAMLDSA